MLLILGTLISSGSEIAFWILYNSKLDYFATKVSASLGQSFGNVVWFDALFECDVQNFQIFCTKIFQLLVQLFCSTWPIKID